MSNPDYVWRPDPKDELPKTLFGLPIYWSVLSKEPKDFVIILGTLDEYHTCRPVTHEELRALLAGKAVLDWTGGDRSIVLKEEGEEVRVGIDELLPPLTRKQCDYARRC